LADRPVICLDRQQGSSELSSAEPLLEVAGELLIGGGRVAREPLDVVGRKVAVALAVGLRVLVEGIGPPFRTWSPSVRTVAATYPTSRASIIPSLPSLNGW
jgi:hypothetical protein